MTTHDDAAPVVQDETVDHQADLASVAEVIREVEAAVNTNDAELLTARFTENTVVVNAAGSLLTGRRELLAANRRALAGFLRDEHVRYELGDVVFLRPDVAIAVKTARSATAAGEPLEADPSMIALYVLVKEAGRWWVAARENTLIPA
ncbi:uncharacterized protein (TIGR02246 family) [Actinoalloteichus hoggarensis]|uniref:DUF4440 domain-containing protein n=1 Tax=Actinoalloteichus hoggarensis TaxID=1470176 RepID=A0A221VW41_9PSEU|nr:SgcJ/EcaC family oxidoreductase [Actinoalloteichus hoggarensis]ASO17762.1 hypothetical protein AHOG_00445 [Actinoalloteichus hoggarensis]MBB5922889.1 uncharacterized protein (TIGR02246 family) [Actinoalloteichus hoggarensis]